MGKTFRSLTRKSRIELEPMDFHFEQQNSIFSLEDCTVGGIQGVLSSTDEHQNMMEFTFDEFQDYSFLDDNHYGAILEESTKHDVIPTVISDVGVKKKKYPFSLSALEILNNHGNGFKRLTGRRIVDPNNDTRTLDETAADQKLSTEKILRIAGERFIQYSSQQATSHPFQASFSGLSFEEIKNVELVELLLASAEKVESQQCESARRLLNLCGQLSSHAGNPVQRVVYYLCEALKEKIDRETGGVASKGLGKNHRFFDLREALVVPDAPKLAFHQAVPFSQAEKLAGIQAIVEKVAEAKKVHVIDLRIANGIQWATLMQALASRHDCQIELLKITAVATSSKHVIEETGKWLSNFASTMNIPFSFKVVMVPNMLDLKEDLFELGTEERIAVYSSFVLSRMIAQPTQFESLIRVIRGLNPCVMVVSDVEANHNSISFVNRFIEALFFYGTFFDCLDAFMQRDEPNRLIVEAVYLFEGMRKIVACEGEERKIRHVKIDVWRAFFQRCGMEELELSPASIYQAKLVTQKFPLGTSCTVEMNGKCLIMGWKGTPLQSLSVWKFL